MLAKPSDCDLLLGRAKRLPARRRTGGSRRRRCRAVSQFPCTAFRTRRLDPGLARPRTPVVRLEPCRPGSIRDDPAFVRPADPLAGSLCPGIVRCGALARTFDTLARAHRAQRISPGNRQLFGVLRGGRRNAHRPRRLSARARIPSRLSRRSCHRLLRRILGGRCAESRLRGGRHRGRVPRDRHRWFTRGRVGTDDRRWCREGNIERVVRLRRNKSGLYQWPSRTRKERAPGRVARAQKSPAKHLRKRKRRSVARAAHVGGGGGTADPSLSRRAGLCLHPASRMRGVLSVHRCGRILVSARCASRAFSRPMSLYRAGLRFALFLPLGVAIPPAAFPPYGCRVRRCEPRCHSALASRGDYLLIEPASENATHAGLHA